MGVEAGIGIFCNHLVVNSSAPRGKIAFFYGCWAIISLLGGGLDENYSLTHQPKAQNPTLIAYSRSRSDNGGTSTATGFRRAAPSRKQLEVSVKQTGHLLDYGLTTKLGLGLRMSSSGFRLHCSGFEVSEFGLSESELLLGNLDM